MRVICAKDYEAMSRAAANLISAQVLMKPESVLGLATGSSPIGTYRQLIEWNKKGDLTFRHCKSVNLDEYRNLPATHDQSYRYFMNENFFDHIDIDKAVTHVPDGMAADAQAECKRYDALIQSLGGVDLQLLGIGHDGHIGFNEPCDEFPKGTHVVDLEEMTIRANARFFDNDPAKVPTQALTMGIGTIMSAKKIVLVASGADKAEIVKKFILGPVCPQVPASILQLHPDVTVVADEAALKDYISAGGEIFA